MALRGYYSSDRHDDPFIESHLDIRDAQGNVVPGYGWIFPMGDGRVNVGVGLLSTDRRWKGVNTSHLMDAFVDWAPKSWGLSPETCLGPPTGGKLPMGLSVGPRAGSNVIVAGDAAGCINPFNGEGIAYGYETGRLAAAALGRALSGEGEGAMADYGRQLEDAYGPYYKVARAFVHMISDPKAMRACNADANVNWAEGMAPSQVNDSARAMMSSAAKWVSDNSGDACHQWIKYGFHDRHQSSGGGANGWLYRFRHVAYVARCECNTFS